MSCVEVSICPSQSQGMSGPGFGTERLVSAVMVVRTGCARASSRISGRIASTRDTKKGFKARPRTQQ